MYMNRSFKNLSRIILIMACVITCLFQIVRVKADSSIPSGYRQIVFNQDNGLGSNEVNCVYQTRSGYIWVGTDGGLYRFGGKEFKIYNLWDTEKADVYFINNLFQDSRGRLWVCTNNYGLFYIKGNDIVHFSNEYYNGVKAVNEVCEGADGTIYVASPYGVYTVNEDSRSLVRNEDLAKHNVKGITLAGDCIFGIYNGNRIFRLDSENNYKEVSSSDYTRYELSTIASDADGNVYVGTIGSEMLAFRDIDSIETINYIKEGINYIFPSNERVYICSDNGVGYINKKREFIPISGLTIDDYISGMIVDYEGNIWMSSKRSGLLYMAKGKFSDFNNRYAIPENSTNCVTFKGKLKFIGTDDGLVVLDENNSFVNDEKIKNLIDFIGNAGIKDILCDSSGNLWLSTYRRFGVVYYDASGSIKTFDRFSGLPTNMVNCTYELSDGRIAIGTEAGVYIVGSDGTIEEGYGIEQGIDYPDIISLYEREDNVLLAGSEGGGLYIISKDKIENIKSEDGLSSDVISSIAKGTNGIWFGTDNGLSYYDETYRTINNIDFSNNIYDLIIRDNKVWIIGSKGLLGTTEDELLGTAGLSERYFSTGDGLSKKINIYSGSVMDENGIIYLCCDSGILTFDTNNYYINNVAPKLNISEVDVDGKIYYFDQIGGELTVPADTQRISITFSVLSYNNRDNISVRYMLNGFDNAEVVLTGNDSLQAVYTNLDGGKYAFTASAVNGDGIETEQNITFIINKETGFFEKTSVRVGLLSVLLLIMFLFIYNLMKTKTQVVGKDQELRNLAQEHESAIKINTAKTDYLANMSNEIKIPVNAIIATAKRLMSESDINDDDKENLRSIVDTGNDVIGRVDETIQLAQLESGSVTRNDEAYSLTTLICDLSDKMMNVLYDKPIKFLVDLGDNIPDILIGDFDKIKAILNIILDNACKFTKEGSIILTVDSYKNPDEDADENMERLSFSVSDTGIGMSDERMEHLFEIYYINESKSSVGYQGSGISLVIAKKLADIIDAEVDVESTSGAGTTFTLTLYQKRPDNDTNPVLASDRNDDRISGEEAERLWTPDVKALLVDDSDLGRDVSLGVLSRLEMKCDVASNGISAIDMVMNNDYDIIFMDIAMPVMNGIDALHEIRDLSGERYKNIPVIGLSEDALLKDRDELTEAGFTEVVVKPFDLMTLASVMVKFLDNDLIKFRTNDVKQYMTESRYSEGLKKLENHFEVVKTLDRIGGSIEVYNRILATFFEQNKDAINDLRKKYDEDFRGFRSRIHNIRTGCQNMGAAECSEITLRIENAINLGDKDYVNENFEMMLSSLQVVIDSIKEYFDFMIEQKGMTDKEYSEKHTVSVKKSRSEESDVSKVQAEKTDDTKNETEKPDDAKIEAEMPEDGKIPDRIIDIEDLKKLRSYVEEKNDAMIDDIFDAISANEYVNDDMEFLEVLGEKIIKRNYDEINDLIETYFSLKSIN